MATPARKRRRDGSADPSVGDSASVRGLRQALSREVNEQIERLNGEWLGLDEHVVLCECGDFDCLEPIEIAEEQYAAVRRFPTRFLVKPGHAARDGDCVVEEYSQYLVVEKIGSAAQTAIGLDRRRTGKRDQAESR